MIANDVFHFGFFHCSLNRCTHGRNLQLPAVNSGRSFTGSMALNSIPTSIELTILFFCHSRVDIFTFYFDYGQCSIKGLIFKLANFAAVDGIGKISAEFGNIKQVSAAADLLIRGKSQADLAMLDLRMAGSDIPWQ